MKIAPKSEAQKVREFVGEFVPMEIFFRGDVWAAIEKVRTLNEIGESKETYEYQRGYSDALDKLIGEITKLS